MQRRIYPIVGLALLVVLLLSLAVGCGRTGEPTATIAPPTPTMPPAEPAESAAPPDGEVDDQQQAELDQAITKLKAVDPKTVGVEAMQSIRKHLEDTFTRFNEAERRLKVVFDRDRVVVGVRDELDEVGDARFLEPSPHLGGRRHETRRQIVGRVAEGHATDLAERS